ncbi:MAG TPA: EamA family transporter [Chitinophagales bacterium]|nr:EamA family transporter [Chitinophagales bacterium]
MLFVLISVICSVTVSVIIKLARRYSINVTQMIAWNYPVAVLLNYLFFKPKIEIQAINNDNWKIYLFLGLLLPSIFLAIAASIRYTGIVRTEIAQRISILIPLIAAFLIFHENPTTQSIIGIAIGIVAVLCSFNWKGDNKKEAGYKYWLYPLIIFFGMGLIDVLFKQVAQLETAYTTSIFFIFLIALSVSFLYIFGRVISKKERLSLGSAIWGISLGLFNFGNILFYMKAHKAIPDNPSVVFTAMNIGVIALGALIGILIFREKLSKLNKIAILLAVLSILIIAGNEFI